MSFEFISNPTAKHNNFKFSYNLLKATAELSGYIYQPNFVLVNQSLTGKIKTSVFGDILPIYSSSIELTNIIVTSKESLANLVILSRTFLVCLLSLLNIVIQNTVYQVYNILLSSYGQVIALPAKYGHIQSRLESLIEVFSSAQGRELWWLEVKIDIKSLIIKANKLLSLILDVSKKFYLTWVVLLVVGFLNYSAVFSAVSSKPNSFLSKFIQNYSLSVAASPVIDESLKPAALSTPYTTNEVPQIQVITQYDVEDGDNLDKITYKFGLTTETIKLNNNLTDDVSTGQKLFIPWVDGYIYNATDNISPQDLEKIYNIPATTIQNQNISIYDVEIASFHKDSLILIPTSDFSKITEGNKLLEAQKLSVEQSKRSKTLSENSISYKKVANTAAKAETIKKSISSGFIWPTSGSISRCFSSIHHGCDIASFAAPQVVAAQRGVVKVGYEAGGYGNYIKVDHGGGLVTLYAHLNKVYVSTGQIVGQGETLGQMGQTGHATGIHLHFEVQIGGVQVDPLPYLPAR